MTVHKGHLLEALRDSIKAGEVTQAEILELLHNEGEKFPTYAAQVDTDDDLEVDDKPLFSASDEGVWVAAWVHIPHPDKAEEAES